MAKFEPKKNHQSVKKQFKNFNNMNLIFDKKWPPLHVQLIDYKYQKVVEEEQINS